MILGIIGDCDVSQRRVRLSYACRHGMIRDNERGEEIQEGKARCPGAKKEEGDEDDEAG